MSWMIIAVVLLVAFGPVLWLMPSRRDRRLSALRLAARQAGLGVEIAHLPKLNPSAEERVSAGGVVRDPVVECAGYSLPLRRRLELLPTWRLLRDKDGSDGPVPGWSFVPRPNMANPYWQRLWGQFEAVFECLPDDAVGLELGERAVTLFWRESPSADAAWPARLAECFRDLDQRLAVLEAEIEMEIADEDS